MNQDTKQDILFFILLTGMIVAVFWFSWFSIRPAVIKRVCTNKIRDLSGQMGISVSQDEYNEAYDTCIKAKGLKP
jgi:hypothetical protein